MPVPLEVIALGRMAFGARDVDREALRKAGLVAYVEEQLHPDDANDPACQQQLKGTRLHIEYGEGKNDKGEVVWKAVKEDRPLGKLDLSSKALWKLNGEFPGEEKQRPFQEVKAATWIRAVHSRWQLREVLVDFWHNHFNVNVNIDNERMFISFPAYDRDVIRKHCLGNFRQFLEAVGTSVPMLLYLNNAASKASPANENYARELFELHTLGAGAYFNHLYNRWRDVPGATEGKAAGYIDQDVYEAARAFTGWTIADGSDTGRGDMLPDTGEFIYYGGWHDPYQKRVLGVEFDPNQPPMSDGRRVLDMLAAHPATASHVCMKLCRRLVADDPPASLVERAAEVFRANVDLPDHLARVVRTILLSDEFAATSGRRVKKPFELAVSLLRATGAELHFRGEGEDELFNLVDQMGQHLFAWPTPTGHPEGAGHWTGTAGMLARWNAIPAMMSDGFKAVRFHLLRQTPATATWRDIARFWANRLIGQELPAATMTMLTQYAAAEEDPDQPPTLGDRGMIERINGLVALLAMLPEFQTC